MRNLAWTAAFTIAAAAAVGCDDSAPKILDAAGADATGVDGSSTGPLGLPRTVDLGPGDCGGTAQQTVTVTNDTAADVALAFASSDAGFTITPSSVTILTGTSTTFTITAAIPATVIAGAPLSATFTVTTDIPGRPTESVVVTALSRGAQLAVSPPALSFGDVALGASSTRSFTVSNTGNGGANLGFRPLSNPDFSIVFGSKGFADLAPGALVTGTATYTPSGLGTDQELVPLELGGGPRCGTPPSTLPLSGNAGATGGVLIEGSPVTFGDVACGSGAGTQTLVINNTSPNVANWTASLPTDPEGDQARYLVMPTSGTIAAGATQTVTVTRQSIATPFQPRDVDTTLRLVVNQAPIDVPIRQTLRGPFLTLGAPTVDFGFQEAQTTTPATLRITNTGNAMAMLTTVFDIPFSLAVPATLAAGDFADATVSYNPAAPVPLSATLRVNALGSCSGQRTFTARGGDGPFPVFTPSSTFVGCPAPASSSAYFQIENIGSQPLTVTCVEDITGGASGLDPVFAPSTITVPAGQTSITAINHGPGPVTPGALTAMIRCTTNEILTNDRTTTLTRTIDGAAVELAAAQPLDFTCFQSENRSFTTTNTGTQTLNSPFPIADLPFQLQLGFDFASLGAGETTTHTITAFGGSGSPFHLLPGLPDPCNGATGSGGLRYTGSVTVGAGSGSGGSFCGVTPATLPVRLFDYVNTLQ